MMSMSTMPNLAPDPNPTDVTDFTDVADPTTVGRPRSLGSMATQLLRDTGYTLLQFPLATASFAALVTGLSLAGGLIVLVVGLPVLVAVLGLARLFAHGQRELVGLRSNEPITPGLYRRSPSDSTWKRWLTAVRTPQPWLDVLHGIVNFPVAILTFTVATVWWSVATGGLSYWFWQQWLPDTDPDEIRTLPELLRWNVSESLMYLVLGIVFAATLIPVMKACAGLHEGLARLLLDNGRVRELEQQVRDLDLARDAAAQAEVQSLRRLERDLHDGPQQRLVRLGMDLATVERRLDAEPESARQLVGEARTHAAEALAELRALSRGIAPPILADRGLQAALVAMASRSPIPTRVDMAYPERLGLNEPLETALYFTVSEALANVAKHSNATEASISIKRVGSTVVAEVVDNGQGGAGYVPAHGLSGLVDRLAAVGGTLQVASPAGGPTVVRAQVPCAS